ncbi:DNA-directed RNA polymerases IV and V subunit 4-like isoform X4 [Rhododendron vialii]|uniref:DNA-directed RNA polymerases IV and V subunit 4-like isoform X4 n=1 Tax=Rhododendron vialii TaxID=182163 RepID=UPI00265E3847|nr:DNA-directed RNA polymerases IV and V subunit 4-like isoform X4 [Rhododendron vialii]
MAEKGGKGFSLPKSSLKSPDSLESEINLSSKAGGKGDTPFGKGGKGDKFANGGKSSMPKGSSTSGQKNEQELPKNAKCLMDCEAADILQGIQEQMVVLSEDPTIKIPIPFDRGLQYAKNGSRYTDPESVRRVLEPLKAHGVSDNEICMIANICPESLDEVFALISSLKGKKNKVTQPLKDALSELTKLKQSTRSSN